MSKHTPGPWTVHSLPNAAGDDEKGWHYSLEAKADGRTFAEHEANARLIAAAPDMLAALIAAAQWLHDNCEGDEPLRAVRAALAKAETVS